MGRDQEIRNAVKKRTANTFTWLVENKKVKSWAELSKFLGIPGQTISHIRHTENKAPTLEVLANLVLRTGANANYILTGRGMPFGQSSPIMDSEKDQEIERLKAEVKQYRTLYLDCERSKSTLLDMTEGVDTAMRIDEEVDPAQLENIKDTKRAGKPPGSKKKDKPTAPAKPTGSKKPAKTKAGQKSKTA